MFAMRFSLSDESDPNSILYFIGTPSQVKKLTGKPRKDQKKNYEVPDRKMERKMKKKQ